MIITSLGACKKSTTKPMETTPTKQECLKDLQVFTGKYQANNIAKDTIEIVFVSDNCPESHSNNYIIKGLATPFNKMAGQDSIDKIDYTIKSNETANLANTSDNMIKCILQNNIQLVIQSPKLKVPQITFKKL